MVSAAFLMNSLPLDTWIRLIDWMAIGLVIYFGYSYTHSRLATKERAPDELPADYKPPIAAIIGIVLGTSFDRVSSIGTFSDAGFGLATGYEGGR